MSTNRNNNFMIDDVNIDEIDADFDTTVFVASADVELDAQAQEQSTDVETDVETEQDQEQDQDQGQIQGQTTKQGQTSDQDQGQIQGQTVDNKNGNNDNSNANEVNIDFGGGEWIPRDDDFIDIDMKGSHRRCLRGVR